MRKKELYYKVLMEKAKLFIQNYESNKMSKDEFILRQVIKSKEFKKELEKENEKENENEKEKEKEKEKGVRFLFYFDELTNNFFYEGSKQWKLKILILGFGIIADFLIVSK